MLFDWHHGRRRDRTADAGRKRAGFLSNPFAAERLVEVLSLPTDQGMLLKP